MSPEPRASRTHNRRRWLVAAAALALLFAAIAAAGLADQEASDLSLDRPEDEAEEPDVEADVEPDAGLAEAPDDGHGEAASTAGLGEVAQADPERRLIREGSVTVGYPDTFDDAYRQVTGLAGRLGGAVLDIESSTDEKGVVRGSVTVGVPAGEFDALLARLDEIGPVGRRDIRTEDVTDEYVDLRSRLRHLERTEEFYLELFDEAETVDDAITVRDRLDSVQERIEEIEGRLRHLEDRTEISRLTVELVPEGEADREPHRVVAGFGDYWADAREGFVRVAGTLLVVAVGATPLVLAGVVAVLAAVVLLRTWRSTRPARAE